MKVTAENVQEVLTFLDSKGIAAKELIVDKPTTVGVAVLQDAKKVAMFGDDLLIDDKTGEVTVVKAEETK